MKTKDSEPNNKKHCLILCPFHILYHVMWVHYHGMAHPQVVNRGDSLQMRQVAVNIFNKQSQTADKGWP